MALKTQNNIYLIPRIKTLEVETADIWRILLNMRLKRYFIRPSDVMMIGDSQITTAEG